MVRLKEIATLTFDFLTETFQFHNGTIKRQMAEKALNDIVKVSIP